ncbi:DENN domain-containing protein 2D isoform X5 [Oryzias latipes]
MMTSRLFSQCFENPTAPRDSIGIHSGYSNIEQLLTLAWISAPDLNAAKLLLAGRASRRRAVPVPRGCQLSYRDMSDAVKRRRRGQKERRDRWSATPVTNEHDDGPQGAFKRISTMWSSFRRGIRERSKVEEPEPTEPVGPTAADSTSKQQRYASGQYFFEYLVVVSLKKTKDSNSYEPQITYQFPKRDGMVRKQKEEEEKTLKAITLFCFPEGISWAPLTEYHSETFSFVLTEIDGSRRNGYCRRLLPGGKGARAPEAYCIISTLACFGLFSKIFDEVEKRRQISMAMIYPFMQKLREASFPAPGHTVEIKSFIPESGTELLVVDVSQNKQETFLVSIGDEASILPPKLKAELLEVLSGRQKASGVEELNRVVSDTFLHFFVRTVGHYASFIKYSATGELGVFDRRAFCKAIDSKTTRHFVKKFTQTQMFDLFIQEAEQQQPGPRQGIFHHKIREFQDKKKKEKTKKH